MILIILAAIIAVLTFAGKARNKKTLERLNEEAKRIDVVEREQEVLRKEQDKQAATIAKHEKRIADLEYKVRKLDRDVASQQELLGDYYGQLDWLLLQQSGTVNGGAEFAKWQNKIVTKSNQIRKAENKLADMKDARERATKELNAA